MKNVKKLHLPYPTGPYGTGCLDFMTEYSPEGCFSMIFYPTDIPSNQLKKHSDKWVPWCPHEMYNKAFSDVIGVPYFIIKYISPLTGKAPYFIPTIVNATLSNKEKSYPLIIFSHGYAATRFVSSNFCNTLASYGYIVAAIEHRDNSAGTTFYYDSPESAEVDNRTWLRHYHLHKTDGHDHFTLRNNQMKLRYKECTRLLNTIFDINKGVPIKNVLNSSFDLDQFKNRIDTEKIIMMGYSFGGSTAMYSAANDSRYQACVILDGWMFPLKSEPILNISQPILFINSHTFSTPSNLNVLRKYLNSKGVRQIFTLKKTTHESPTDLAYMNGHWLDLHMLVKMNPKKALNLQNSITVRFLRDTIGYPTTCDNAQIFIKEHSDDFVEDVISYTKRVKRKMGMSI